MKKTKENSITPCKRRLYNYIRIAINIVASIVAMYVGGWLMFANSVIGTVTAIHAGTITLGKIVVALIKCLLSATVAGAIWCVGYILGNRFRVYDDV